MTSLATGLYSIHGLAEVCLWIVGTDIGALDMDMMLRDVNEIGLVKLLLIVNVLDKAGPELTRCQRSMDMTHREMYPEHVTQMTNRVLWADTANPIAHPKVAIGDLESCMVWCDERTSRSSDRCNETIDNGSMTVTEYDSQKIGTRAFFITFTGDDGAEILGVYRFKERG